MFRVHCIQVCLEAVLFTKNRTMLSSMLAFSTDISHTTAQWSFNSKCLVLPRRMVSKMHALMHTTVNITIICPPTTLSSLCFNVCRTLPRTLE
uniref:Uncharacterized protein n=1 Tax=Arundo donax TaxID=35708 RepID=A0A0A9E7R2_ARUDO